MTQLEHFGEKNVTEFGHCFSKSFNNFVISFNNNNMFLVRVKFYTDYLQLSHVSFIDKPDMPTTQEKMGRNLIPAFNRNVLSTYLK